MSEVTKAQVSAKNAGKKADAALKKIAKSEEELASLQQQKEAKNQEFSKIEKVSERRCLAFKRS